MPLLPRFILAATISNFSCVLYAGLCRLDSQKGGRSPWPEASCMYCLFLLPALGLCRAQVLAGSCLVITYVTTQNLGAINTPEGNSQPMWPEVNGKFLLSFPHQVAILGGIQYILLWELRPIVTAWGLFVCLFVCFGSLLHDFIFFLSLLEYNCFTMVC